LGYYGPPAQKRIRRDAKQKVLNHARCHRISTFVKKAQEAVVKGSLEEAQEAARKAQSELSRGVTKGVLRLTTASCTISRIFSKVSALSQKNLSILKA